jgi:integrase
MTAMIQLMSTRYVLDGKRVAPGTPGAKKVTKKSKKWYAVWRENGKIKRQALCTDKGAAQKMLANLLTNQEKGVAGLVDETTRHMRGPIEPHIVDFLAHLKTKGVCDEYYVERERCLRATVGKAETLTDWTADKIEKFIAGLKKSARTKEIYRAAAFQFGTWCVKKRRLDRNPVENVTRPQGKTVRKRRALSVAELQKLLDVTRVRPVHEFSTVRIGPNKGKQVGKLKPETRARLERLGWERSLIYKMAIYTGLRRGEVAALRVEHLHLEAKPFAWLQLPGEWTKNGEQARLLLIPSFSTELERWIKETRRREGDLLFAVPNEMVVVMKKDLKAAGIEFKVQGRQSDIHSLRMVCNTMLGQAGVSPRVRMLFMRHSDIQLTMDVYDDSAMSDMATAAEALEKVGLK